MSGEKTADLFLRRTPLARGGHRGRGRRQRDGDDGEGEGARSVGRESAEGRGGGGGERASDERGRSQEKRRGRPGYSEAKRDRMIFCYKQSDNRGHAVRGIASKRIVFNFEMWYVSKILL